jgi:hypothetical protein
VKLRPEGQRKPIQPEPGDGPALDTPVTPPRIIDSPSPGDGPKLEGRKKGSAPANLVSNPKRKTNIEPAAATFDVELGTPEFRK